tara:strand:+ start:284 stop:1309 length:1026 start_codon:yes stop_codon:yes gene_type:complete
MSDDNIPVKESSHGGIPVTDVESAQRALLDSIRASKEQPEPVEEATETQEAVSEQAMDVAESVENDVVNTQELTADDLVDDGQQEQVSEPKVYTVKIDGKDAQVTEDELLSGYSRQADYTRKSQVLAEQRKKIEEELSATQQERQRYQAQLEQFNTQADSKLEEFKSVDWTKLKEEDPMEYALKRDQYRELQESKRTVDEEQQTLLKQQQKEAQQKWQEELARQQEVMSQRLPEWNDPEKGPKLKQDIKAFAMNKGFTEQEVNTLIDARSVDVLHKAMMYESLLAAKIANKKAKVVPKMQKPGTPSTKSEVNSEKVKQTRARLKRTGKVDDAAAVIKSLMS